jgi:hypothetical protein
MGNCDLGPAPAQASPFARPADRSSAPCGARRRLDRRSKNTFVSAAADAVSRAIRSRKDMAGMEDSRRDKQGSTQDKGSRQGKGSRRDKDGKGGGNSRAGGMDGGSQNEGGNSRR